MRQQVNEMLPQDPNILLSYVNLKLRDQYTDLEAMCEDLDISEGEIREKLETIGYEYRQEHRQFVSCRESK